VVSDINVFRFGIKSLILELKSSKIDNCNFYFRDFLIFLSLHQHKSTDMPCIILFLQSLGTGELIVILLFVLFFFGSKKIPELARGLGKGMREMKDAAQGIEREIKEGVSLDEEKKMIEEIKRDVKDGLDPEKEPR